MLVSQIIFFKALLATAHLFLGFITHPTQQVSRHICHLNSYNFSSCVSWPDLLFYPRWDRNLIFLASLSFLVLFSLGYKFSYVKLFFLQWYCLFLSFIIFSLFFFFFTKSRNMFVRPALTKGMTFLIYLTSTPISLIWLQLALYLDLSLLSDAWFFRVFFFFSSLSVQLLVYLNLSLCYCL